MALPPTPAGTRTHEPLTGLHAQPVTAHDAASMQSHLQHLLRFAIMAPSSHNTQPWLFRVDGDMVFIHADRRRRLAVVDPIDRELTISVGAAVCALRVAMRAHGIAERCALLPSPSDQNLLAIVRACGEHKVTDEDQILFRALPERRTNRSAYSKRDLPDSMVGTIARAVESEGAMLHAVDDNRTRHSIADLISEGDKRQFHDHDFRKELAHWVRPNKGDHHDGMPMYSQDAHHMGGMWDTMSHFAPLVVRTFLSPKKQAAHDADLAEHSPVLGVIATRGDMPIDWLHAGQGLMRGVLHATACGVAHSYLNQPVELPDLRVKLRKLLGVPGVPQLVLRLGFGEDVPATPRRPLAEVMVKRTGGV